MKFEIEVKLVNGTEKSFITKDYESLPIGYTGKLFDVEQKERL